MLLEHSGGKLRIRVDRVTGSARPRIRGAGVTLSIVPESGQLDAEARWRGAPEPRTSTSGRRRSMTSHAASSSSSLCTAALRASRVLPAWAARIPFGMTPAATGGVRPASHGAEAVSCSPFAGSWLIVTGSTVSPASAWAAIVSPGVSTAASPIMLSFAAGTAGV